MPKTTSAAAGVPSRREARRLVQQDVSRAQLLDAAEEVFGRKGFHEATLKEVAELAEFSVGSVYSFFDSKDELFQQIFVRRGDQFMPRLREIIEDSSLDPVDKLHALIDFEIGFFREHPRFGRLYLRYSSVSMLAADREVDMVIASRYEEAMQLQASLFRVGQIKGRFRRGDADVLSRLFSGLMASYQAMDPLVVGDDPDAEGGLALSVLHDIVASAFVIG